jgi:hypothetical protein
MWSETETEIQSRRLQDSCMNSVGNAFSEGV